jgi:hypothetical protein
MLLGDYNDFVGKSSFERVKVIILSVLDASCIFEVIDLLFVN